MKTREDYEQMVLDTRPDLELAIEAVAGDAITTALALLERHYEIAAERGGSYTGPVRNRHEAYGIAAEQNSRILKSVNTIKGGVSTLLGTLADPNYNAIDATSSIVNSATAAAQILINAAAEMRRTLDNLYTAELTAEDIITPLEAALAEAEFQEAEPADADSIEETETEDN